MELRVFIYLEQLCVTDHRNYSAILSRSTFNFYSSSPSNINCVFMCLFNLGLISSLGQGWWRCLLYMHRAGDVFSIVSFDCVWRDVVALVWEIIKFTNKDRVIHGLGLDTNISIYWNAVDG